MIKEHDIWLILSNWQFFGQKVVFFLPTLLQGLDIIIYYELESLTSNAFKLIATFTSFFPLIIPFKVLNHVLVGNVDKILHNKKVHFRKFKTQLQQRTFYVSSISQYSQNQLGTIFWLLLKNGNLKSAQFLIY